MAAMAAFARMSRPTFTSSRMIGSVVPVSVVCAHAASATQSVTSMVKMSIAFRAFLVVFFMVFFLLNFTA